MENFIVILFNGVTFGMVLYLISAGLSIVMGIMGLTNLAHGAMYMVGAYVGWTVAVQLGLSYYLALVVGAIAAGTVGLFIERIFLRRLYRMPNEQVLVTFGFVLVLTNLVLWIWGGRYRMQFTAPGLMGTVEIGGIPFDKSRLFILSVGIVLAVVLWWIQDRTRLGAVVRAGMDDQEMATGLGINLPLVSAAVFFGASALAGFGGVMGSQIIGPNPAMGLEILLLALIVTVVGGVGTVQGALVGALVIGVLDTLGKWYFPQFGLFTMYLILIAILLVRPTGIVSRRTS